MTLFQGSNLQYNKKDSLLKKGQLIVLNVSLSTKKVTFLPALDQLNVFSCITLKT